MESRNRRKIRTTLFLEGKIRPDGFLILEGDRIRSLGVDGIKVGNEPSSQSKPGEWAESSDGILVPSLADAHVHLRGPEDVEAAKRHGVTALRDLGSRQGKGLALTPSHPEIRSCGSALVPPTGYGRFLGEPIRDLNEAGQRMRRLADEGATFIKAIGSGLVQFEEGGGVSPGGFDADELRSLVKLARTFDLGVSVHVNGEPAVSQAVHAGALSVEHGFFISDETLARMRDTGTFWVPTVFALAAQEARNSGPRLSTVGRGTVRRIVKGHLRSLRRAFEMGVPVALGTDAGSPGVDFGSGALRELEYWFRVGVSLEAALDAAVSNSRRLSGLPVPDIAGNPPPFLCLLKWGTVFEGRLLAESGHWTEAGSDWLTNSQKGRICR